MCEAGGRGEGKAADALQNLSDFVAASKGAKRLGVRAVPCRFRRNGSGTTEELIAPFNRKNDLKMRKGGARPLAAAPPTLRYEAPQPCLMPVVCTIGATAGKDPRALPGFAVGQLPDGKTVLPISFAPHSELI